MLGQRCRRLAKIAQTLVERRNKLFTGYCNSDCAANHRYAPEICLCGRLLKTIFVICVISGKPDEIARSLLLNKMCSFR